MEALMARSCSRVFSMLVLTYLAAGVSLAQSPQPQPAPKPTGTLTTQVEDVSKWTRKQWSAAKAKWSEETVKWNDCQTQAKGKKLSGRKSWPFLYDCMTK
jgi:hypothetical protein